MHSTVSSARGCRFLRVGTIEMCKPRLARAVSDAGCREQRTFASKLSTSCSPTVTGTPRALPERSQDSSVWECCVPLNRSSSSSSVGRNNDGSEYTGDGMDPAINTALETETSLLKTYLLEAHSENTGQRDILRLLQNVFWPGKVG